MKIDRSSDIGRALREARLAQGIAQGDLADMIGVSIWILNKVEHGVRRFDTDWLPDLPRPIRDAMQVALRGAVDALDEVEA